LLGGVSSARDFGVQTSKLRVWRDAQEADEALRKEPNVGKMPMLEDDETVFK
jgi:hypothetical protein